jgi:hypothetical protein
LHRYYEASNEHNGSDSIVPNQTDILKHLYTIDEPTLCFPAVSALEIEDLGTSCSRASSTPRRNRAQRICAHLTLPINATLLLSL